MPELPEVETTRLVLCKLLLEEKIKLVKVINNKLRYEVPKNFSIKTKNKTIKNIIRRGKFLIFDLSQNLSFISHLGMTGIFRIEKKYQHQKHDHVSFFLNNLVITYNDVRKFGFFKLQNQDKINESKHLISLGVEPLSKEFNANLLEKLLHKKSQNIKSFLMNQKYIAGLGNIYCSESLFEAGISPLKICRRISRSEIKKIVIAIKKVQRRSVKKGGTSLQNFEDPHGNIGYFSNYLKVYNRNGKSCYRCKKNVKISKLVIQGRSTFYCQKCQK